MNYKRILTIQDISCVGQCSLTVALPILSVCGIETAVLPSTVLSNHTAFSAGFTFRDLTDDMPVIAEKWKENGISFEACYSGYLGSARQIELVDMICNECLDKGGLRIVDPAMADDGKLYPGFDLAFVDEMKKLVYKSDICLPNVTEAALLTGMEFKASYDESYIDEIVDTMLSNGAKSIVITGVSFSEGTTGVLVVENGEKKYYRHKMIAKSCYGTGDGFASAFTGALMRGKSMYDSAVVAAEFVQRCIERTIDDKDHWYGVKFELALPELIEMLNMNIK